MILEHVLSGLQHQCSLGSQTVSGSFRVPGWEIIKLAQVAMCLCLGEYLLRMWQPLRLEATKMCPRGSVHQGCVQLHHLRSQG